MKCLINDRFSERLLVVHANTDEVDIAQAPKMIPIREIDLNLTIELTHRINSASRKLG